MEEWETLEWEQLRVDGKPLLSGAAFGATPLLCVACRAQPCLVHFFCDTKLQDIWRFPSDPVFLLIGSDSRRQGDDECQGRLLVITRDGCVWIVPLPKPRSGTCRPSKKRKTLPVGEIQRVQPRPTMPTISEAPRTVKSCWKVLPAQTYPSRALEVKNVVVVETLMGTVPGATVAAFGPGNHVALGSSAGSPELLNIDRLAASDSPRHPEFLHATSVLGRGPTCLLVASHVRHSQNHGPGDSKAYLSQDLFESLFAPSAGASNPEVLFIQGGMDGKVCTFHMKKGTLVAPPYVVCDLQQPVVTIIPIAYPLASTGPESDGARRANWLLVVGVLGKVAFLSAFGDQPTLKEPNDGPFLAHTSIGVENQCTAKELVVKLEGVISGPITSACLVSGARLCYTVGSVVFMADLFGNIGSGGGVEKSKRASLRETSPTKLPCQRMSFSNVAAITTTGLFTYNGTHSLVALSGAGRLFSIKISKHISSSLLAGVDGRQDSLEPYAGRSVTMMLQSIADAESCRDAIRNHEQALTLAMNELALALPRARDIATDKKNIAYGTNGPEGEIATALECTLVATPLPSTSLGGDQLCFGGSRQARTFVDRSVYKNFKTRLDISLINHSKSPLSQYWSCVLTLRSCLSNTSPTSQFSFTINNGHGLPVGFRWNYTMHVNLPGGPWGPVMATMHLCHIHDSHKALLQNSRGLGLGRASSAGCVALLCQRIDLFSLLQGPQSTLGHTPWTPAFSGHPILNPQASFAGMSGIEMFDLADSGTLGPFSGDLTWSFSPRVNHSVGTIVNGGADWQNGFLRYLLQQPSTSAEWKRLRVTSQGGGVIAISIDGRGGQGLELQSVVTIQTPCLLLGILLREALLQRLMGLNAGALGGIGKEVVVLHRNERMNFVTRWNDVQALAQRAKEALNLWKKFQRHNARPAQDLLTPLVGHTYVVISEIILAYKVFRATS